MSVEQSRFAKLTALAAADGSENRRALLREVTDLFFENETDRGEREQLLFDEVLSALAADQEEKVLAELAERMADAYRPPRKLILDLVHRPAHVASPVLRKAGSLTDEDLIQVVDRRSQEHVRAIAQRPTVSEALSDAIVRKGDDETLNVLLRNEGARFARPTMEVVLERARDNEALHEATVGRADMPIDLLNELYFTVADQLRGKILERNASIPKKDLDAALERARARIERTLESVSQEAQRAQATVRKLKAADELKPAVLVSFYRESKTHEFIYGLAELTDLDPDTTRRLVQRKDLDGLAMVCRAASIDRALYVTLAVLIVGGEHGMKRAEEFGKIYSKVPIEAAQRAMRFFKIRKGAGDPPAPAR